MRDKEEKVEHSSRSRGQVPLSRASEQVESFLQARSEVKSAEPKDVPAIAGCTPAIAGLTRQKRRFTPDLSFQFSFPFFLFSFQI